MHALYESRTMGPGALAAPQGADLSAKENGREPRSEPVLELELQ